MTYPWTYPDWDNRVWPRYYDPINNISDSGSRVSEETVISSINDGYHNLCLYVNVPDGVSEYLPKDGRIPGLYYMYEDEDGEHIIQVKKGPNWFNYKQVSENEIITSDTHAYRDGIEYSFTFDTLRIGKIIYSTNEFWIIDYVSDEVLNNIYINYRLLIVPQ